MKRFSKLLCFMVVFISVMAAFCTVSFAATAPTHIPIHKYTFDGDTGTNVSDSGTPGGISGNLTGTTKVTGISGSGISFNVSSDKIDFTGNTIPKGNKTIRFWVKRNSIPTNFEHILSTGTLQKAGETAFTVYLRPQSDPNKGKISFAISDSTGNGNDSVVVFGMTSDVCDGEWHNIMAVFNDTERKLYICRQ